MTAAQKVVIADDHPLFREALRQALTQAFGDLEMVSCGAFSSLQRVLDEHKNIDLILLDLHMPGAVGFSALRYLGLRCPEIPVAIVSAHEEHDVMMRAIEHGASGFIAKSSTLPDIIDAVQRILLGEVVLPKGVEAQCSTTLPESSFSELLETLTPKQFRVLMMLVDGKTNREIAEDLFVSEATIKAHLTEIYRKLGVSNRTQAATLAAQHLEVEGMSLGDG